MDLDALIPYWGLVAAGILVSIVILIAFFVAMAKTAWARLRAATRALRTAERERKRTVRQITSAEQLVQKLEERAERVKPRSLTEARGALDDARALGKIAEDKWMVAANHVRQIIIEDYPPHRHARLRARYLPGDGPDGRPFSF